VALRLDHIVRRQIIDCHLQNNTLKNHNYGRPLSVAWAKSIIFCQCLKKFFLMTALFSGPG